MELKKKKIDKIIRFIICICIAISIFFIFDNIINFFKNQQLRVILNMIRWPIILANIMYSVICGFKIIELFIDSEKDEEDKQLSDKLKNSLLNEQNEKSKDIINLMIENMIEIREYFKISKIQARHSFFYAVIASITGLILFIISIIIALIYKQISSSIITAVGGVIIEIVSIIALKINKQSQIQLNRYYDALHDNEKYLSTISLIGKLSTIEQQDKMYSAVINNYLK